MDPNDVEGGEMIELVEGGPYTLNRQGQKMIFLKRKYFVEFYVCIYIFFRFTYPSLVSLFFFLERD